ncbi:MAG: hypothetical protein SFX18_20260 [Pirellulales bacterium]|nr:hypothetical protein [Pirellulales bacterium]
MSWTELLGKLLGLDQVQSIDHLSASFAAGWARGTGATWVLFGCLAAIALAITFYLRWQTAKAHGHTVLPWFLAIGRAIVLCILILLLAEPVLRLEMTHRPQPLLWVLFDGTESMAIRDDYSDVDREKLAAATGWQATNKRATDGSPPVTSASKQGSDTNPPVTADNQNATDANSTTSPPAEDTTLPTRLDYVKAQLSLPADKNVWSKLQEKFRLRAFVLEAGDGVRPLDTSTDSVNYNNAAAVDPAKLAAQLTNRGEVTALGQGLEDLVLRHSSQQLAGVVVVSDFGQNAGIPPVGSQSSPVSRLGRPIYTIGIGPESAVDVSVDLQAPLVMKKGESESLTVTIRQNGLDEQTASLKLTAKKIAGDAAAGSLTDRPATSGDELLIGQREVPLAGALQSESFSFQPNDTGHYQFTATLEALPGEIVKQNNTAQREVNIRDDFLRLMYVEHEPSWEWRFIKEVFHRDKLVGLRGFRTFLNSADPKVRQTNELFLPNLTPKRSDFFANDVIFLGDMPAQRLQGADRFCEMTREFVSKFGGGLVVIAGPRFGPGQLANSPLADMLPVIPDPQQSRPRDDREFTLQLTPQALQFDFMRLGGSAEAENKKAWANLGRLPWYQPVLRPHPQAIVLAEHPTDLCADGKTRQPLIAVRPYGKGEVIYIGFNETWRLRRKFGETYYRQFWGQMIHRLGLSHAIGSQKRFVVRTDRDTYQAEEQVTVTVEAYDANYEPLASDKLAEKRLVGEILLPSRTPGVTTNQPLGISQIRDGVFEARFPVANGGEHRVRVLDPITREYNEVRFQVTSLSAERRSAVRNKALEQEITLASGGKMFDLTTANELADAITAPTELVKNERIFPLGSTWLSFGLVIGWLIVEWLVRKLINLA